MKQSVITSNSAINIYLHTHWDREWYLPFESFRARLVETVGNVVQDLETDRIPSFLLDGQAAVLEDVLVIRPDWEASLQKLMASGKLEAGPWYILADQMLVSGESLVRNLEIGLKLTAQIGKPCLVGYCPDTFGHTVDLPRILAGFSIGVALVWRGVPELNAGPLFRWFSPDGSSVLTYRLEKGYYQTFLHEDLPSSQEERLAKAAHWGDAVRACLPNHQTGTDSNWATLVPVGGDHLPPPKDLLAKLTLLAKDFQSHALKPLKIITLGQFFQHLKENESKILSTIPKLECELRDNALAKQYERAFLLPGVLSTRLYLKRANRLAEKRLQRFTEPLITLISAKYKGDYPQAELLYAWKLLLQNQPHDSICGCSVDEVHREMITRFNKLGNLLDELESRALRDLGVGPIALCGNGGTTRSKPVVVDPSYPMSHLLVFNPSSVALSTPIRFCLARSAKLASSTKSVRSTSIDCLDVLAKLGKAWQVSQNSTQELVFSAPGCEPSVKEVELWEGWLWANNIPAIGCLRLSLEDLPMLGNSLPDTVCSGIQLPNQVILKNDCLEVNLDHTGLFTVRCLQSNNNSESIYQFRQQFIDCADAGDAYNFDPIENDIPIEASFRGSKLLENGPLVVSLRATYEIVIPLALEEGPVDPDTQLKQFQRSKNRIRHTIETEVSLHLGSPLVYFDTIWENFSRDHRLELHLDTGSQISTTYAENHFSMVKRTVITKSNSAQGASLPVPIGCESIPDRFPCQRFLVANGQAYFNTGLPEYGTVGSRVTLTVLRAVSRLSRQRLRTRGSGAGPPLLVSEANCLGMNRASYAWAAVPQADSDSSLSDLALIEVYRLAEIYEEKSSVFPVNSVVDMVEESFVELDNLSIQTTAMYRQDNFIYLRLLNVTMSLQQAVLKTVLPIVEATQVKLNGDVVSELSNKSVDGVLPSPKHYHLSFKCNELLTLRFKLLAVIGLIIIAAFSLGGMQAAFGLSTELDPVLAPAARKQMTRVLHSARLGKVQQADAIGQTLINQTTDPKQLFGIAKSTAQYGHILARVRRMALTRVIAVSHDPNDLLKVASTARQYELYDLEKAANESLIASLDTIEKLYAIAHQAQAATENSTAHLALEKAYKQVKTVPEALVFAQEAKVLGLEDLVRKTFQELIEDENDCSRLCALLKNLEPFRMHDQERALLKKVVGHVNSVEDCKAVFDLAQHFGQLDIAHLAAYRGRKMALIQKLNSDRQNYDEQVDKWRSGKLDAQEQQAALDLDKQKLPQGGSKENTPQF